MKQKFLDELKMKSKKISAFLFANLISVALLFSEIDLKSMADSDLVALQEQIKIELAERKKAKSILAQKELETSEKIVIPEEYLIFKANEDFTEVTIVGIRIDDGEKRVNFEKSIKDKIVQIPSEIQGIPVTKLEPKYEIRGNSDVPEGVVQNITNWRPHDYNRATIYIHIKNLYIPDGIKITPYCFAGTSVDYVRLPEDLEEIPGNCFKNSMLKGITVPSSVKKIGEFAFYNCGHISRDNSGYIEYEQADFEINFNEGLEEIGVAAFAQNKIKTLEFPESLRKIKVAAFRVKTIEKVVFNEGLEYIGGGCFYYDDRNEGIEGTRFINYDLVLPKSLVYLGSYAFKNTGIKSVSFPKNLKAAGQEAFYDCNNLESLEFEEDFAPYIDGDSLADVCKGEKIEKSLLLQKKLKSVKCNLENKKFMIEE